MTQAIKNTTAREELNTKRLTSIIEPGALIDVLISILRYAHHYQIMFNSDKKVDDPIDDLTIFIAEFALPWQDRGDEHLPELIKHWCDTIDGPEAMVVLNGNVVTAVMEMMSVENPSVEDYAIDVATGVMALNEIANLLYEYRLVTLRNSKKIVKT